VTSALICTVAGLCAAQKGQPGDGVCNILDIEKYSEGMKHRGGPLDCQEEMVREMFDCVDNALLVSRFTNRWCTTSAWGLGCGL
jgi:hypothetical protein